MGLVIFGRYRFNIRHAALGGKALEHMNGMDLD